MLVFTDVSASKIHEAIRLSTEFLTKKKPIVTAKEKPAVKTEKKKIKT